MIDDLLKWFSNKPEKQQNSSFINNNNYIEILEKLKWALEMSNGIGIDLREQDARNSYYLLDYFIKNINNYLISKQNQDGAINGTTKYIESSTKIIDITEHDLDTLKKLKWGLELCFDNSNFYSLSFRLSEGDVSNSINLLSYLIKYLKDSKKG